MKNLLLAIVVSLGMLSINTVNAAAPAPVVGIGSSTGASLVAVIPVAAVVAAVLFDKVQACDNLPVKTVKSKTGNYSYAVTGCSDDYPS